MHYDKFFKSGPRKNLPGCPGGFQRRAGRPAFGTRFCPAKSSVLYLLRPLTAERDCPCSAGLFRWQQNRGLQCRQNCKNALFGHRRSGEISSAEEMERDHRGSKRVYKARRSDVTPRSQYHHGSSSHTLSRASASVVFALLSER